MVLATRRADFMQQLQCAPRSIRDGDRFSATATFTRVRCGGQGHDGEIAGAGGNAQDEIFVGWVGRLSRLPVSAKRCLLSAAKQIELHLDDRQPRGIDRLW